MIPAPILTRFAEVIELVGTTEASRLRTEASFETALRQRLQRIDPSIQEQYCLPVHTLIDHTPVQSAVHFFDLFYWSVLEDPTLSPVIFELKVGSGVRAESQTNTYLESWRAEMLRYFPHEERLHHPWGFTIRFQEGGPDILLHRGQETWQWKDQTWIGNSKKRALT